MDDHDEYLEYLVRAADRIAEATRTRDLQIVFREIDRPLTVPVPDDRYHPGMALLAALAAQVNAASLLGDRIAWARRVRSLEPFLGGGLPQLAAGMAASVFRVDRGGVTRDDQAAITDAFHTAIAAASAAGWLDPVVALAVALGMQINTGVSMERRNFWTYNLPAPGRALEVAA